MNADQWRAPGREQAGGPGPAPEGPGPSAPSATPGRPNPYATPPRSQSPPRGPASSPGAFATSDRHRERVLGGEGYDSPSYTNDKVAVTAMVLGIVGIPVPGVSLLAITFGHLTLRRLRTSYRGGRGLAVAGLVMGYTMTAIWLGLALLALTVQSLG